MKPLTPHEEFCLKNAAHLVAARGRAPATRTREQLATLPEAQAFGAAIGGRGSMIEAVTSKRVKQRLLFIRQSALVDKTPVPFVDGQSIAPLPAVP